MPNGCRTPVCDPGRVSVLISDLLAAPELCLSAVTQHCTSSETAVSWVSTTELDDPVQFLRGGELVLTTALRVRAPDEWERLVRDLTAVPVAGVCVGIGLIHDDVPPALRQAADRRGLALLSSPVHVPFIQISKWVADRIFAERYRSVRDTARLQDEIMQVLLAGRGLRRVVHLLAQQLRTEVAVLDATGTLLVQQPRGTSWHLDEVARAAADPPRGSLADTGPGPADPDSAAPGVTALPVRVDGDVVGYIAARGPRDRTDLLTYVANLVGLEVARRQALQSGRRELAGQVVADIVHGDIAENEARRRLHAIGVEAATPHRVIAARGGHGVALFRSRPLDLVQLLEGAHDPHLACRVDDDIIMIVGADTDTLTVAEDLASYLGRDTGDVRVGVGGTHRGASGIRTGYHEARLAQRRGTGVRELRTLSLTGLLLGSGNLPMAELASALLDPLRQYDSSHGTSLESTLREYLTQDGSAVATCRAMNLHRNTLRYRLEQVERLSGKRLASLENRLELWLALRVLPPSGP